MAERLGSSSEYGTALLALLEVMYAFIAGSVRKRERG